MVHTYHPVSLSAFFPATIHEYDTLLRVSETLFAICLEALLIINNFYPVYTAEVQDEVSSAVARASETG